MEVLAATAESVAEPFDEAAQLKRPREEQNDEIIETKKPKLEEELVPVGEMLLPKNEPEEIHTEQAEDLDSSHEVKSQYYDHDEVHSDTDTEVNELDEVAEVKQVQDRTLQGRSQENDDDYVEDEVEEMQDNISDGADDNDFSEASEDSDGSEVQVLSEAESEDEQKIPRRPQLPMHFKLSKRLIKKSVRMLNKMKIIKLEDKPEILNPTPSPLTDLPKTKEVSPKIETIQIIEEPIAVTAPLENSSEKSSNAKIVIPDEDDIGPKDVTIKQQADVEDIDENPVENAEPIQESTPFSSRKAFSETEPNESIQPPINPVCSKKVHVPYVPDIMSLTQPETEDNQLALLLKELEETSVDQLQEKYMLGSDLVHFQGLLRECEAANKRWQDRCEKLWNDRLNTSCKIFELMKRAERKHTVNNFAIRVEQKRESPPPLQYPQYNPPPVVNNIALQHQYGHVGRRQQDQIDAFLEQYNGESTSNTSQGQGRQGAIVDVQSLIADYRSKHPQDVPRRGRRMKNYSHNSEPSLPPQSQSSRNFNNNFVLKNHNAMTMYPMTSSSNYYGGNGATTSQAATGISAPTTSLLHGILTKTTPPTTSFSPTLARLLTAPERHITGRNNSGKMHNNGEITITPISVSGASKVDFSMGNQMDEDDNSIDRLVIDEGDDDDDIMMSNSTVPYKSQLEEELLCQGCHRNSAKFLCAGCSKQWYCNRKCQIAAWDQHSEHCSG